MKNHIVVLYHSADFDGLFCREIARKHFGDFAEYIGWDYGQPVPKIDPNGEAETDIYMLDISIDELMDHPCLVWIDHHKSAIDKYKPTIKGYRMDGVAACRLAWQWFNMPMGPMNFMAHPSEWFLPEKKNFVDRKVVEPLAVRLAGEYDIWDKRDPNAELFQHGLRSQELSANLWELLLVDFDTNSAGLRDVGQVAVDALLERGEAVQYAKTQENKEIITAYGFTLEWEGLKFLVCNHARFNSHLFTAGIRPEHDGLFGFNWAGNDWRVSLYGVPGKDIDLSQIAVKYGGGGHKSACGFRTKQLPFLP